MSALWYLFLHTVKNAVIRLFKKPGALILYLLLIGFVIFAMVMAGSEGELPAVPQNVDWFYAFALGMFALIFFLSLSQGLKQGAAIFKMSDVNLLFTAPVRSQRILVYGLAKQAGTMILASVFLIAQYPNIRMNFGLGGEALAAFMIAYVLLGVVAQLMCVNLYAYCAGAPERRAKVERVLRVLTVLLIAGFGYFVLSGANLMDALRAFAGGDFWNYIPVLGWSRAITAYGAMGQWGMAALFMGLMLLCAGGCVLLLTRSNADYYEDVLLSAENAAAMAEAAKTGQVTGAASLSRRAKREMSPLRGRGAGAFYYRMQREQSRKSMGMLDLSTAMAAVLPLAGRLMFGEELAQMGLIPVLLFGAYLMVFLNLTNPMGREFAKPYLYLCPASSFAKLWAISMTRVFKQGLDGMVFAVVAAVSLPVSLPVALLGGLVYWSLGTLYTAGTLLVQRLLGGLRSTPVVIFLYILLLMLLAAPGFVGALILEGMLGLAAYGLLAAWNVGAACLVVALCHNLLTNSNAD